MPRAKDTDPITGYIMVPERPRRNLTYGQPADTMSTKKDYGDWLQGHIMRSKTRVKYAKELGMDVQVKWHEHQEKVSRGRLARLAASKARGKVKQWKPLPEVN